MGTRSATGACEKILKKAYKATLKSYKRDFEAMHAAEKKVLKKIAIDAFKQMDDGPYYKVAESSLKIDNSGHYRIIDLACADFG